MLDAKLKSQLSGYLQRITHPVEISAAFDESAASVEMRQLLNDVADASPLIRINEASSAERRPSFSIHRAGMANGPRFAGVPMGHEFTSLVLAPARCSAPAEAPAVRRLALVLIPGPPV